MCPRFLKPGRSASVVLAQALTARTNQVLEALPCFTFLFFFLFFFILIIDRTYTTESIRKMLEGLAFDPHIELMLSIGELRHEYVPAGSIR